MTVCTYRKKPVEIQALLFDGVNADEVERFVGDAYETYLPSTRQVELRTLEGPITASAGDYVIRGVQGEFYPCKPDVFAVTYDPVAPTLAERTAPEMGPAPSFDPPLQPGGPGFVDGEPKHVSDMTAEQRTRAGLS